MERGDYGVRRWFGIEARWFGAAFVGVVACGGADNDDLLKPQSGGGQVSSPRGGSAGTATGSGGVSAGGADSDAGGQAGSDNDAGSAGASATGGSAAGGVGGNPTGGVGGKATGGVGGNVIGGVGGNVAGGVGGNVAGGVGGKTSGGVGGNPTGGVGGNPTGGVGGKATGGVGGKSTGGAGGASAGAAGTAATCPGKCDTNADCRVAAGAVTCTCRSGYVGNGQTCARPTSCLELHTAEPTLASGAYPLKPLRANTEITTYCEMTAEGGGWTLVLNDGPTFEPSTQGVANAQCYRQDCTNLAYSTVPVGADVMLDLRDSSIVAANYLARVIIVGVEARTRGKTVRELFTGGPYYLEKEDNTNLTVRLTGTGTCIETLPLDFGSLVCKSCPAGTTCDAPVLVFGDADPGCVDDPFTFAIGGASTYTTPWGNCAGWPQDPKPGDVDYYPNNFRVWLR